MNDTTTDKMTKMEFLAQTKNSIFSKYLIYSAFVSIFAPIPSNIPAIMLL
jgi:hypothetical protein